MPASTPCSRCGKNATAGVSEPEAHPEAATISNDTWREIDVARSREECMHLLKSVTADVEVLPPIKQSNCGLPAPVPLEEPSIKPAASLFNPSHNQLSHDGDTLQVEQKHTPTRGSREPWFAGRADFRLIGLLLSECLFRRRRKSKPARLRQRGRYRSIRTRRWSPHFRSRWMGTDSARCSSTH